MAEFIVAVLLTLILLGFVVSTVWFDMLKDWLDSED